MRQVLRDSVEKVNVGSQRLTDLHEKMKLILIMRFQI